MCYSLSFSFLLLLSLSLVKKKILLNQYSYTHTHIKTANYLIVMPEYDTHNPKHRYAEIDKIIAEIERIIPKIFDGGYEGRKQAETHIRNWYANTSLCQIVTQRDRIQTAWTRYDYAIIEKHLSLDPKVKRYERPEELV